jgi:hypothetical protein
MSTVVSMVGWMALWKSQWQSQSQSRHDWRSVRQSVLVLRPSSVISPDDRLWIELFNSKNRSTFIRTQPNSFVLRSNEPTAIIVTRTATGMNRVLRWIQLPVRLRAPSECGTAPFYFEVKWTEVTVKFCHVHWGDLILRVLDGIVTISFGVYLVLWLF